ncbi:MAG: restriction endonuclease subunit S [Spirochaetia bacterium]|nr:restriction endonuclease subunit S [Spirochaetia bacterium]
MNEWKTVRLGDVCEILNGYAFKSDKYVDSGIRVIRITNVQKGFIEDNSPAFYPITEKENLKDYELYENDLLISLTGNVGRVALLSKEMLPAALNQRVGCIRIRDKNLLISYLFTFLNSDKFESDCIYSARGIAQKNMSTEWLKNYLIPLPPIEVQIKIANNLNTCAKIIKKHNKQLNNFDLLIKSRFIEMFGDPVQNPMGWEEKRFKDICDLITDGEHNTPNRSSKGIYLLSARNIHNHILKLEDVDYIDEEEYARISKRIIPQEGDVLISCSGSVGRVCSVPKNFKFQMVRSVALLRLKEIVTPLFMEYLIESDYLQNQIDKAKTQSSQANLFQGKIAELKGFVPPLALQQQFASFVQQIDKSKFAVQKSLEKAETLYKSLMQEYFG